MATPWSVGGARSYGPTRRRVGSEAGPGQHPGGERSPWKERATEAGNGGGRNGPDSGARPRGRGSPRSTGNGVVRRSNGEGATATATWCGCGRGEFFEGCETRRGKCPVAPNPLHFVQYRFGRSMAGNAANLMTGSGMQQARNLPSGGSRRGGAKPRGRNRIPRLAASGPNRVGSNVDSGEWTLGRDVGGGGSRHPNFAGLRRPQGLQGPPHGASREGEGRHVGTNPTRGGRISDQGDR